jgi:aminocarboxymuconate-semialdehyde decarboxylase
VTVIDAHTHFLPPGLIEVLRSGEYELAHVEDRSGSGPWLVCEAGLQFPLAAAFHDVDAKLAWMDERGIDVSITSVSAPLFLYELPGRRAAEVAAMVNDAAAQLRDQSDGRLVGIATVPMTDPEQAAEELRRACGTLGLKGVEIGTSVGDKMLDDPALEPFWAAAEELGATVFLHPYTYMLGLQQHPGFQQFFLLNTVGNPLETHLAAGRLILGGVFDRHPGLVVQLSHGGGGLPFQLARLQHTYKMREAVREVAKRPPFEYLDNLLFDTVLYDERPLEYLLDLVGPERVIFGTDGPFDIADMTGVTFARRNGDDVAAALLEGNARRIYKLDA